MIEPFGRTNLAVPEVWFRISPRAIKEDSIEVISKALDSEEYVVDIHNAPVLLGHALSESQARLMHVGDGLAWSTSSREAAANIVSANVLSSLSTLRGRQIDFWFLDLDRAPEQYQLDGALQALTEARQDGLIGSICLRITKNIYAGLSTWRFNDAFEVVTTHGIRADDHTGIVGLAAERRVGLLLDSDLKLPEWPAGAARLETIQDLNQLHSSP